ncbi:MAG: hypothetical protein QM655_03245 [Nocardioidaceae bacterium]
MKDAIKAMSPRTKTSIFWVLYGASILLAVFPPFYLAGSGKSNLILGIPFSALYWIIVAVLCTAAVWLLWTFENIRGEVGDEADMDEEASL